MQNNRIPKSVLDDQSQAVKGGGRPVAGTWDDWMSGIEENLRRIRGRYVGGQESSAAVTSKSNRRRPIYLFLVQQDFSHNVICLSTEYGYWNNVNTWHILLSIYFLTNSIICTWQEQYFIHPRAKRRNEDLTRKIS